MSKKNVTTAEMEVIPKAKREKGSGYGIRTGSCLANVFDYILENEVTYKRT